MGEVIFAFHPKFAIQSSLDKDETIYRIFPQFYFEEFIERKQLYFKLITRWLDGYEYPTRALQGEYRKGVEDRLFGLCFARNYDKEAMWKLYSRSPQGDDRYTDRHGICIKTSVGALCKSLLNMADNPFQNLFIGKVKYVNYLDSDLAKMFYEDDKMEYPGYMYPAYIKREAFEYEEEIRVLLCDITRRCDQSGGSLVDVEDLSFIHGIILSPDYPKEDIEKLKSKCKECGIDIDGNVSVEKSKLWMPIQERSAQLPPNKDLFWGGPKGAYSPVEDWLQREIDIQDAFYQHLRRGKKTEE